MQAIFNQTTTITTSKEEEIKAHYFKRGKNNKEKNGEYFLRVKINQEIQVDRKF